METETEIYFYSLKDKNSYMSNFYKTSFTDKDGINYNSSEQYFMYYKCKTFDPENKNLLNLILAEKSASKIKKYGRLVPNYKEDTWQKVRFDIMLEGIRLKFNQNEEIKKKLLMTKDKTLYEASKYDKIWGIGFYADVCNVIDKTKFGKNLLGIALMKIRNELNLS